MTLQEAKLLHAFTAWADNRIFEVVARIPEAEYMRDMKSSHGSIHGTLAHIVAAQKIWLSRWRNEADQKLMTVDEVPSLKELKAVADTVGFEMAKFLGTMTDKKLQESFSMRTSKGDTFTHTYAQAFHHLVDHSTYHRGQVITMLRQLGVKPPSTGMIMFFRETAKFR